MMKTKFKKRYVLGTGYPWANGLGTEEFPYFYICLDSTPTRSGTREILDFPPELWSEDLPEFRLILERIT